MYAIPVILWLAAALAFAGPALARAAHGVVRRLRAQGWGAVILAAAALIAATLYGGSKGTTNPPVGPRAGVRILMRYNTLDGRLHPVGAPIKLPEVIREQR
jgi:hypothetical protein